MIKNRHSIRLSGYDYTQSGWYFVTICTQNRENMFGEIRDGKMVLNDYGTIINAIWYSLPKHHNVKLDEFQIMPNHVHFIVIIPSCRGCARTTPTTNTKIKTFQHIVSGSLPCVIRSFKSECTKQIHAVGALRAMPHHVVMPKINVWQRNYYERIIRDEEEYINIKKYIQSNPSMWDEDENNVIKPDPKYHDQILLSP